MTTAVLAICSCDEPFLLSFRLHVLAPGLTEKREELASLSGWVDEAASSAEAARRKPRHSLYLPFASSIMTLMRTNATRYSKGTSYLKIGTTARRPTHALTRRWHQTAGGCGRPRPHGL